MIIIRRNGSDLIGMMKGEDNGYFFARMVKIFKLIVLHFNCIVSRDKEIIGRWD
jgi:hypothetical protein